MPRFNDERAPLECTAPSKKQKMVGCPHCKSSRSVSTSCCGFICSKCDKYISEKEFLPSDQCDSIVRTIKPIDTEFTKVKAEMERKAYAWKDEQEAKGNLGTKSHEPDFGKRNW